MTPTTRQTLTGTALACCAALLLASTTEPLLADDVTFQFTTTIDTRPVGGPTNAPLTVTYTFDSESEPLPGSTPGNTGYSPIHITLQLDDQIVTTSEMLGFILVGDNWGDGTDDGYDVRFDGPDGVSGQLFGLDVVFFRFLLVDSDGTMLANSDLPVCPSFATGADFIQINLELSDPTTGERFDLGFSEGPDTHNTAHFSLSLVPVEAIKLIEELSADVVALELDASVENGLLGKLDDALGALTDGHENNDHVAINMLEEFIDQASAQRGKKISAADADLLIGEADYAIAVLLLLFGC